MLSALRLGQVRLQARLPMTLPRGKMRWFGLALIALIWAPLLNAQRGVFTVQRDLAELTDAAAIIVRGRVISAHVEPHPAHPHLQTVVVVLAVEETLKGATSRTFTFRQFAWDIRDRREAAGYRKGDEYVLLMNPPSAAGLRSPVGLEQGRFRIRRDREGNATAVNGHGNYALFGAPQSQARYQQLPPRLAVVAETHRQGPLRLDDLRQMIQQLVISR